ncbi:carnitinyl-CoA dehydratase [Variibacter gotjawalensis]|uniref:Carnitinyl-CoA dehydratase n=1 Tax=Variibacter gotjawalensis TaxID=1333996 RepID=A0A0S3PUA7_9BRAD|nr:enoyl-CoA hydratase-related protein [Variibacter gotjawalensis]NIK49725.1 enoyl-CoA hydratase/carnithine racemase [Variibacter gotjawalensis]RZS45735.1 enoyl-CoA hydratase/carnithine racemase [Variibacter gotjawalensis]BAT59408.1 carnitinyl-CoA dehydratase [Variibacter gotjawalensis]
MSTDYLQLSGEGGVATLTLNNPAKHNAMNFAMWQAMPGVLQSFTEAKDARVLVLRGAGERSFSSGNDVSEFDKVRSTPEQVAHYNNLQRIVCNQLGSLTKPTIAQIDGYCLGAGLEFALLCDFRFCTPTSRFAVPAVKLGLPYRYEDITKLLDVIGPARTKEMVLDGRRIDGVRAAEIGLVTQLVQSRAELEAKVSDLAQELAESAPLSLSAAKITIAEAIRRGGPANLAYCDQLADAVYASADYVEGRNAFAAKRKPRFAGR